LIHRSQFMVGLTPEQRSLAELLTEVTDNARIDAGGGDTPELAEWRRYLWEKASGIRYEYRKSDYEPPIFDRYGDER